MIEEIRETVFEHTSGSETVTFSTGEKKRTNEIYRLKEKYPQDVRIMGENEDGSIYGHIPADWIKIKPKKKVELTEEQREASKARLAIGRERRLRSIEDNKGLTAERT